MDEREDTKAVAVHAKRTRGPMSRYRVAFQQGHVKRAIRAADGVYAASRATQGVAEEGVVLMTAVLLVERLANAAGCRPLDVLDKMAECYEIKRVYANSLKQGVV